MSNGDDFLGRLLPAHEWVSDWPDVLERAGASRQARVVTKRRLVFAFAVLAAVLVPFVALGAANDWWFLTVPGGPTPTKAPSVVQEGVWDGHAWQMIAYPSTTDDLCVAITPKNSADNGTGGAQECGPFVGTTRTPETKASPDLTITYLSGASKDLPAYIAGPVIGKAVAVEVRFGNGTNLRVPTFAGPGSLKEIRFYATQLPTDVQMTPGTSVPFVRWVAGLDTGGNVVACLAPLDANDGVSPLSACR